MNHALTQSALPPEWSHIDVLINNAGLALGLDLMQGWTIGTLGDDDRYQYQGLVVHDKN
ncbi:MAG: hypothetical protein U0T81_04275 [Saprospiraceae bacterium]